MEKSFQCYLKLGLLTNAEDYLNLMDSLFKNIAREEYNKTNNDTKQNSVDYFHIKRNISFYKSDFFLQQNEYVKALQEIEECLLTDEKYVSGYFMKIDILMTMYKSKSSYQVNYEVLENDSNKETEINTFSLIMSVFDKLLTVDDLIFPTLLKKCGVLSVFNSINEAIECANKCTKLITKHMEEKLKLNNVKENETSEEMAINYSNLSNKFNGDNIPLITDQLEECLLILGNCYFKQKDFDKCMKVYEEILELNEESDEAYLHLGKVYFERTNYDKSLEYLKKALTLNPYLKEALIYQRNIYFKKNLYNEVDRINSLLEKTHYGFFD